MIDPTPERERFICSVDTTAGRERARADANLIAAAPDLYAALEEISRHLDATGVEHEVGCNKWPCRYCIARVALARARGEV